MKNKESDSNLFFKRVNSMPVKQEKVFWIVVYGFSNKEIAEKLYISPETVKTYLNNIYKFFKVSKREHLILLAAIYGFIQKETVLKIIRSNNLDSLKK